MSQKRRGSNTMSQKWRGSFVHTVPKIAWLICTALFQKWRGSFVQWLYTLSQKWRGLFVHTVPKMAWLICTHCSKNGAAHLYSRSKKLSESPHKTETDPMQWFMFGFSGFCVRYTLYVCTAYVNKILYRCIRCLEQCMQRHCRAAVGPGSYPTL